MEFLIIIGGIGLLLYIFKSFGDFENKIEQLEYKVRRLEGVVRGEVDPRTTKEGVPFMPFVEQSTLETVVPKPVTAYENISMPEVKELSTVVTPQPIVSQRQPVVATAMVTPSEPTWWTSQSILTKVGAVLVLISVGSFLGYAIVSGWIGPVAQVLLAFATGGAILAYGVGKIDDERQKGALFVVLGTAIILLSVLVAIHLYELIGPWMGGLLLWLPIVVTTYLSIHYRYEKMAVFSLGLAMFVPALIDSKLPGLSISVYLGIISLGATLVAMTIGSRSLVPMAVIVTAVWTLNFAQSPDKYLVFTAVNCLVLLFSLANMVTLTHEREGKYSSYVTTASITGVWLFIWISTLLPEAAGVPLYLMWSVLFIFGAYVIGRVVEHKMVPRVYMGVSVVYLTIAILYLFDGASEVLVLLAEVTTLVLTYLFGLRETVFARRLLWAYSLPLIISLPMAFPTEGTGGEYSFNESTFIIAAMSVVMLSMGWLFAHFDTTEGEDDSFLRPHHILYTIGGFFFNALLVKTLQNHVLVITWLCEVGALALYNLRVHGAATRARVFLIGYVVPLAMALPYLTDGDWQDAVIHIPFLVTLSTIIVIFSVAVQFSVYDHDADSVVPEIFYSVGTFFSAAFIWLVLHAAFAPAYGVATVMALIIYTAVGLTLYVGGLRTYDNYARILGLVGIGGVVVRLGYEALDFSVPVRIIAFMVIGLMLLSTAFITKGKRGVVASEPPMPVPPATSDQQ